MPTPLRAGARRGEHRISGPRDADQRRVVHHARVGGVQSRDVGQHDEQVGVDQRRGQRREVVVVAEVELLHRDGVVLVDDRDDAEAEQRAQRMPRVQVPPAIGEVGVREQHLGDVPLVHGEAPRPGGHQRGLSDGGRRLPPLEPRTAAVELDGPGGDRARADQHHLATAGDQRR